LALSIDVLRIRFSFSRWDSHETRGELRQPSLDDEDLGLPSFDLFLERRDALPRQLSTGAAAPARFFVGLRQDGGRLGVEKL